ncbi:GIY-YIG nuclease family protein [Psychroflexus montanilacus]|uniref:GIY-YIG nuclease family protein n=1 Tax=Psychroflexus montanilacus TaxID=2873598 RepID=UPI001CC935C1|nr:GIY-YIG nuclease family protein [Psychroflexus montanilacus]MBZ9651853.1 GIY-YIG nuclease family protein [Psychroflexus montanilacus]
MFVCFILGSSLIVAHNENLSRYTSNKGPWRLIYLQSFQDKKSALIREKKLKKYSKDQIERLMQSQLNEIHKFRTEG